MPHDPDSLQEKMRARVVGQPPPARETLFDLAPFEREDTKGKTAHEVRKITCHVKKTEYERRVPTRTARRSTPTAAEQKKGKPKKSIAARFEDYHTSNPHVYRMLVALARKDKQAGMKRAGVQMYLEQVRFRMRRAVQTGEPFRVSNDFAAHYARRIMQQEPDLDGFFEVRELKSE